MVNCPKCGKGFGLLSNRAYKQWISEIYHEEWNDLWLHMDCYKVTANEEADVQKKLKLCENCQYYRDYSYTDTIDVGLFTPNFKTYTIKSLYCAKFGFNLEDGKEAEKCTNFISRGDYKEKCLRGEINPNTEQIFKLCAYCKTSYDINKSSNCPKCGA